MKRIILNTAFFGILLLLNGIVSAQFIDNYGLRVGVGLSNQYWEFNYHGIRDDIIMNENRLGPAVYLNAEKMFNKNLAIRTEFGYNQKGFSEEILSENDQYQYDVILHNLSLNIAGEILPLDIKLKPYIILGLRVDYLLDYKTHVVDYDEGSNNIYHEILDDYNKFVLSGLIGIGLVYNEIVYINLEFNPGITKNYDSNRFSIKDRYYGFTLGLNISSFMSKSE